MSRIFIIGDAHFPFHDKKILTEVLKAIKRERPNIVVQIGDLYDQYGFSKYTKKKIVDPDKELKQAFKIATEMWTSIRSIVPSASKYQLIGNHDIRMLKRAQEKLPEVQEIVKREMGSLYSFSGVKTIISDIEELILNDIVFMHGHRSKLGDHMRYNRMSTVCGHSHSGGVVFERAKGETLFELNVGYIADPMKHALIYRNQKSLFKWTRGYGVIDDYGPRFCPL